MAFHKEHIRFLEHSGMNKPYLERNFMPPQYIGQDGEANPDNILASLDESSGRFKELKKDEKLKPGPTAKFDPDKAIDPTDFASKPTNPDIKTVELPLISDVWNGVEPINYHAQIEVGDPPQKFYVDLDTGSSLFWLQSIIDDEKDPEVLAQSSYQPAKSTASVDQFQEDKAKYGDGDIVNVFLYKDRVTIGKMTVPDVLLGAAATSGVKEEFKLSKANGLLGLGFPTDPANWARKNLVQTMYEMGMVKHPSFGLIGPRVDPKLADKIDQKTIMQPRGTFVIGSVDPAYYTGSIAWCPQIVSTNRWVVKLDKILINGKVAFEDQLALIDTGTAYIVASPSNFDKAQKSIPGAAPLAQKKGLMFTYPAESLQAAGFVFGGREIRLRKQDFGLGAVTDKGGQMCSSITKLESWEFPDNLWVIGGIFLDNVVSIFDYKERRVGFADINEGDLANTTTKDAISNDSLTKNTTAAAVDLDARMPEAGARAFIFRGDIGSSDDEVKAKLAGEETAGKDTATRKDASTPAPGAGATNPETVGAGAGAAGAAGSVAENKTSAPFTPKVVASDIDYTEIAANDTPPAGREWSQTISFAKKPECQVAVGFSSFSLGWQHVRAITFVTENHYDSFKLNFNASADTDTHGVLPNPDSDTVLRSGKVAWLRALPDDPNIQTGRWTLGNPYPKGKQLPPGNTKGVKFPRSFDKPPKVVLWLSAMDFSKSVNWRLKADVVSVDRDSFSMNVGPWEDTILYKADVCWIAHADIPGIQSGTFSTEDVRAAGSWQLETSGFAKFEKPFAKPPKLVAALNKIEFGYWRDMRVSTTTEPSKEGIKWSMNSTGDVHQYITRCSYIAFDPDLTTVSAAVS